MSEPTLSLSPSAFEHLGTLARRHAGFEIRSVSRRRAEGSLDRYARALGIPGAEVLRLLRMEPDGPMARGAIEALLVHETSFFRDSTVFGALEAEVLPELLERFGRETGALRVWSAATASGQEAYSVAILLEELLEADVSCRGTVLGTDLSAAMVERAARGVYLGSEVTRGLSASRRARYLEPAGGSWRVSASLRTRVRFEVDNLSQPVGPEGPVVLALCRYVVVYLTAAARAELFARLARAVVPGGYLVLGSGELPPPDAGFEPARVGGTVLFRRSRR